MKSSGLGTTNSKLRKPRLGIIGGSGLCSFPELKVVSEIEPETKYGFPSDIISICDAGGELVAFLPRHGPKHTITPHEVPYKANLAALKSLGVEYVIGTCMVGSLKREIVPGSIVMPDQFVNLTWGRDDFFGAGRDPLIHLPMGEPYCGHLREKIIESAQEFSFPVVTKATVAVIQGPRFSTLAESRWYSANGWDIVNMTQYPECYFARELGLCYAAIAAVTDFDVGLQESLTFDLMRMEVILEVFRENIRRIKSLLRAFIGSLAPGFYCGCASNTLKAYYDLL